MNRYQQYRKLKKLKKLLNAPVKQEGIYTPPENLYLTTESRGGWNHALDVDQRLRLTQVEKVARLLLQQIAHLQPQWAKCNHEFDEGLGCQIERTITDSRIILDELDSGVLFTEAEKAARKLEEVGRKVDTEQLGKGETEELDSLRSRVEGWQQELVRRKKKCYRMESSIRDLSLNIHDVRCSKIRRDQRACATALDLSVKNGIHLFREVVSKVQTKYRGLVQD